MAKKKHAAPFFKMVLRAFQGIAVYAIEALHFKPKCNFTQAENPYLANRKARFSRFQNITARNIPHNTIKHR